VRELTIRDLKTLRSAGRETTEEKRNAAEEKGRTDKDKLTLLRLTDEMNLTTSAEDNIVRTHLNEGLQNLSAHETAINARLERINAKRREIGTEANAHLSKANAILEKVRKTRFSRVERSSLEKIESEQAGNIKTAREILESVKGESPDFGTMLEYAKEYYDRAEIVSDSYFEGNDARDFTGHTLGHIVEVRGKMQTMLSSMQNIGFSEADFFSGKTMDAAAAFHDTGMDANVLPKFHAGFLRAFKGNIVDMGAEGKPRDKHAVTSAIHLLESRDREMLTEMGASVDQAAFLINLHSKKGYLEKCLNPDKPIRDLSVADYGDIKRAAENFKSEYPAWDMSWLHQNGDWNEEALRKTALSASILRLADANRDGLNLYAQKGVGYSFANKEACRGREPIWDENEMYREVEDMSIAYNYGGRREELKPDLKNATEDQIKDRIETMNKTRAIVFGESNIDLMEMGTPQDGKLVYSFVVDEPEIGMGCTAYVIQERINEIWYSAFSDLQAFGGRQSDCVIEISSNKGSVKKIADYLKRSSVLPPSWRWSYA
jgi:hypothetical protein